MERCGTLVDVGGEEFYCLEPLGHESECEASIGAVVTRLASLLRQVEELASWLEGKAWAET